ncbi:methyltransferase [Bathymodiolus japonicus methanotrophic gill symbiont]|uniref:methyltransferase n=1 Tax=Bathymodiolus japonicus methanotrophic gill symbiont TaxID=113269 RepID=UPI00308449FA
MTNHANVFSHKNLDIGTRFFLEHLPKGNQYQQVIDLGCGNGVVGLVFAASNLDALLLDVQVFSYNWAKKSKFFRLCFISD